jgi:hypothetical protein
MNIFKSSNMNSMTLKRIETLMGKIVHYGFFYIYVKFHGKFIIKCNTFGHIYNQGAIFWIEDSRILFLLSSKYRI